MDVFSTVTSKGQVTIPKAVRDALRIAEGDRVLFRVEGQSALMARVPDLLDLAGTIPTPPNLENLEWSEVRDRAWRTQTERNL